jgi:hypothetical protein
MPETLSELVDFKLNHFTREAAKHRSQHRRWWKISTVISIAVAFLTAFDVSLFAPTSKILSNALALAASGLAITLPAITAYIVLRSPEQLWIMETLMRNRLSDLKERMRLEVLSGARDDTQEFRDAYFKIMTDASDEWQIIKKGK